MICGRAKTSTTSFPAESVQLLAFNRTNVSSALTMLGFFLISVRVACTLPAFSWEGLQTSWFEMWKMEGNSSRNPVSVSASVNTYTVRIKMVAYRQLETCDRAVLLVYPNSMRREQPRCASENAIKIGHHWSFRFGLHFNCCPVRVGYCVQTGIYRNNQVILSNKIMSMMIKEYRSYRHTWRLGLSTVKKETYTSTLQEPDKSQNIIHILWLSFSFNENFIQNRWLFIFGSCNIYQPWQTLFALCTIVFYSANVFIRLCITLLIYFDHSFVNTGYLVSNILDFRYPHSTVALRNFCGALRGPRP